MLSDYWRTMLVCAIEILQAVFSDISHMLPAYTQVDDDRDLRWVRTAFHVGLLSGVLITVDQTVIIHPYPSICIRCTHHLSSEPLNK
jgi:hypothetical protein